MVHEPTSSAFHASYPGDNDTDVPSSHDGEDEEGELDDETELEPEETEEGKEKLE